MASLKKSAIQLVLKAKDAMSGKVKKSAESLNVLKGEAAALKDQLGKLKDQKKLLASFEKQTRATQEAGKAFSAAKANVERLAKEVGRAEKPTKGMQTALAKARREVKKSNSAYGHQREALAKLREQLTSAGLSTSKLAQQQERLEKEIEETGNAFEKTNKKIKVTDRTLKKSNLKKVARDANQASASIGGLTRRFAGLIGAAAGLYAIKRGIEGILSTGDQFEKMRVQLEAITGSMAEGEKALSWIKEFTKNTPFQLEEVSEAFVRLKAFGLDPMDGTMQAIIDQASKLGGGMERLNGISLAVGKAWAKQKLQGEEIMMLLERGVPVWELLEKVTGKNVAELQKLSSAGKLGRDVMRDLIAEIGKSSEGAAAKNMSLLSGYVSNLKDSWSFFLDEIANSGALDYAKETLAGIAANIERMNGNGQLSQLAKKISDAFVAMGNAIRHTLSDISIDGFVVRIKSGFTAIEESMAILKQTFTVTSNTVKFFFNSFTVAVKGFATVYTSILYGVVKVWQEVADALGFDGIAEKLKGTTDYLGSLTKEFATRTAEDFNQVKNSLVGIYDGFAEKSEAVIVKATNTVKKVTNSQKILWQSYADELVDSQKKVQEELTKTADTAKTAFKDAADAMAQVSSAETRTELASLGVTLAEALSAGTLSQEEYYQATEASREKLAEFNKEAKKTKDSVKEVGDTAEEAGEQQAEALTDATSIAGVMAGHYNTLTAELQGMSGAAHDAFVAMNGVGNVNTEQAISSISELKSQLEDTREELNKLQHSYTFDVTGISSWMNETAKNAAYVKSQYLEQKIALEELLESYEQGDTVARSFIRQGERAADTMNLLNNQDLDRLNNAIRSAEQNMASLGDSSRNTLNSLQDELDELQGRQSDIEQRRYQTQRDDLKALQAEAIAKGDQEAIKNITSALRISEQIYNERLRQANNEKSKALQESQVSTSVPTTRTTQTAPQKIIRLEYPGGAVNVGIDSTDETKLLEALKNAGMRTV